METPYRSTETEAWCYIVPSDGWWFTPVPVTRTVQFATVEAAETYLGVTLRSEADR